MKIINKHNKCKKNWFRLFLIKKNNIRLIYQGKFCIYIFIRLSSFQEFRKEIFEKVFPYTELVNGNNFYKYFDLYMV